MSRCRIRGVRFILLGLLTLVFSPCAHAGQVYDLASDWSDTNNPNGAWQYGTLSPSLALP